MNRLLEAHLRNNPHPYLTEGDLEALFDGSPDSRYGKVKRLIAQGQLLHIRRGIYCMTEKMGYVAKPYSLSLAQYIYGPSCISLHSALSFHGLIPEAVYTTTSITIKRSKEFQTPLGVFDFVHFPIEDFYTEVEFIQAYGQSFLMAKPWRALCDYVFYYKKDWNSFEPLLGDLRINEENLPLLTSQEMQILDEYYRHSRITRFLKGIRKEGAQ
jgi:hypothetical protein